MGDTDHIARFREGARAWNAWRAEYPGITPDLRDFVPNLGEKQLGPAHGGPIDLSDSLLNGANLHGATLLEARLGNADLRLANLTMALLAGADLSYANLGGAVFDHADLADVSLRGAILDGARLELARNLTQTQIDAALGNVDTVLPPDLQVPTTWLAFDLSADKDLLLEPDDDFFDAEPHEVLGLEPRASAEEIRRAYLRLAKKYHPDVNPGDLIAERRFKTINEAYQRLTAPEPKPQRGTAPWAVAAALFIAAFAGPSLAVYWLGVSPFKGEPREVPRQAERTEKSRDRLAVLPERSPSPSETEYTGALPESPPVAPVSQSSGPSAALPEERSAAMAEEAESQRIKTAAEVQFAMPPAYGERSTRSAQTSGGDSMSERALVGNIIAGNSAPAPIVSATRDTSSPPPERMAALQPPSPAPAETANAPWDDEWARLQGSNELLALHGFIQRYREKPAADEARGRFRAVVAALESPEELKKFVRETVEDSPERALVKRQLALLVERETVEGDKKAWDETREKGSIAALRAYLLSYPNGKHVDQAEERLAALEEEASGRKKDSAAWSRALRTSTRAGYEAYLTAQPDGRYVDDAKRKIRSLAAAETTTHKEDEAWARANKERTRNAYYAYLNAYPNGRYSGIAQETIEKAERPPQVGPRRTASETQRGQRGGSPRWPSSDEPFVDRIQGAQ